MAPTYKTLDGNEAVASVAHRLSEVSVIYPITPSSPMGEFTDAWAAAGRPNLWGQVPKVMEMQSEAGAAGAVHGVLQGGSLATTYTASQGLLLMIPNMYKIAGEQLPFVMHVAARTLATHALSIFGDHSDVMGVRQTGFAMLAANSVQEAHDFAAIAHAATLEGRLPILHFFDGFRTSHEVAKIEMLSDEQLSALISDQAVADFRGRAMNPNDPVVRGTAQNPDVFFQTREAANPVYNAMPGVVLAVMDRFAELTGRRYKLFDYEGAVDAEKVIVAMGSGAETVADTVNHLADKGEKVGVLKVRLYRPLCVDSLLTAIPDTAKKIAVLDRTKEPGAPGEPLYLDLVAAFDQAANAGKLNADRPAIVGGRYGLSSKEFTPGMVKAVIDGLDRDRPKHSFTVGIFDDVTSLSLPWDPDFEIEPDSTIRAMFYGLGADGTVGANKNSIKIIGEETDNDAQGYFVYDSKKSGAMTVSHLRFGPGPLRTPYLVGSAGFIGCHQFGFLEKFDVLEKAQPGATFLLNAPYPADEVWDHLPKQTQQRIIEKDIKVFVIDALTVARDTGMGGRINTIMQTCFFAISGVLPRDEAIARIKDAIEKTYGKKGPEIVRRNFEAVDATLAHLHELTTPDAVSSDHEKPAVVPAEAPDFVQRITAKIMAGEGDLLPVSALPADGTWPTGTTKWEKRGIAAEIPVWEPQLCIQCNKCAFVCPHGCIRSKAYDPAELAKLNGEGSGFQSRDYKGKDLAGSKFTIQVSPDDCTGCHVCVMVCPAKDKASPRRKAINMQPRLEHLEAETKRWKTFEKLPHTDRDRIVRLDVKGSQFLEPLFEFSGACAGCGETPYIKLVTQLFGDRMMIANATGCSSIYGGNLPTTPYCTNAEGRGPTWNNSLFEDNAEFGLGFRLAVNAQKDLAMLLLKRLAGDVGEDLAASILSADQTTEPGINEQRQRVAILVDKLKTLGTPEAKRLLATADTLVDRSVWIFGGDGWAYDIGYGGLDHVLASGENVNVLVLDTEVYSNTGGQSSKATPLGAAAKFAAAGKTIHKKDLGLMAMSYGHVYVASVAFGAKDAQTVQAIREAESYPGPSLIIAYSHCIAHGYDLKFGTTQQTLAVDSGVWPLYRFDPRLTAEGKPPLQLDSPKKLKASVSEYHANETRFKMVQKMDPQRYAALEARATREAAARVELYQQLAGIKTAFVDDETGLALSAAQAEER